MPALAESGDLVLCQWWDYRASTHVEVERAGDRVYCVPQRFCLEPAARHAPEVAIGRVPREVLRAGDIPQLAEAYDGINIKLDKCGGIQQAYRMIQIARALGMKTMLGCMISSSVSKASINLRLSSTSGGTACWLIATRAR